MDGSNKCNNRPPTDLPSKFECSITFNSCIFAFDYAIVNFVMRQDHKFNP